MGKLVRRSLQGLTIEMSRRYPIVTITGPRQSGKTTMARMAFPRLPYANLEDPEIRAFSSADPKGFLSRYPRGAVIDEFQNVPALASYIQVMTDDPAFGGRFILTGSRNLAVRHTVSQSLAGRTAVLTLLPFSIGELPKAPKTLDELIYSGFYPRIHDRGLNPTQALSDYVGTYLERDLRNLNMVRDLSLFQKFLGLCAGRAGQLLNLESLGNDTGVSHATAREWLSLLEASYVAFRLQPFARNISKRLIKAPKLYFYDVGLAAYLMGLRSADQIGTHPLRGALFENLVVVEALKFFLQQGPAPRLYFYRDSNGNEVDLVIEIGRGLMPVEIKSAETVGADFFKGLVRFEEAIPEAFSPLLVYAGKETRTQHGVRIENWKTFPQALAAFARKSGSAIFPRTSSCWPGTCTPANPRKGGSSWPSSRRSSPKP